MKNLSLLCRSHVLAIVQMIPYFTRTILQNFNNNRQHVFIVSLHFVWWAQFSLYFIWKNLLIEQKNVFVQLKSGRTRGLWASDCPCC